MENNSFVIFSLLGIAAILWLYFWAWKNLCVDEAREDFFAARQRLLNLVLDGKMDIDNSHYREIRLSINKLIRFSHEITIWRIIATNLIVGQLNEKESQLRQAVERIEDDNLKDDVSEIICDIQDSVLKLVLKRSFFFVSLIYLATKVWKFSIYAPKKFADGIIWIAEKSDDNSHQNGSDVQGLRT